MLNSKCKGEKVFQVINLGVPGYDIPYAIERFRLRGVPYQPDLVTWLFIHDDFNRFQEEIGPTFSSRYNSLSVKDKTQLNDYHPTKEGYTKITDALFTYLTTKRLIPCSQ